MKRKITKRGVLIIINCIALAITLFTWIFMGIDEGSRSPVTIFSNFYKYLLAQCLFTFMTLVIYYLSIIADAMINKRDRQDKNDK